MALRKKGYPFLFLDAAVTNINMQTGDVAGLGTRTAIHMPQATESGKQALMASLSNRADEVKLPWGTVTIDALPSFWGPLWHVRLDGLALEAIGQLRGFAWKAYHSYCEQRQMLMRILTTFRCSSRWSSKMHKLNTPSFSAWVLMCLLRCRRPFSACYA